MSTPVPTILVVGATGNTGTTAVRTLSNLVAGQSAVRILGLTRSTDGAAARELAGLPQVEMAAKGWTTLDAAWLREQNVVKAFVASHNEVDQFVDESNLYVALLGAGVDYVVRVSTFEGFMSPSSPVFYGRTHWSLEQLLKQPEFAALKWTSLRPNYFSPMFLQAAVGWLAAGRQGPLKLTQDADAKVAYIDPADVGLIGATLLALADHASHDGQAYILNGPADWTGKDLVALVGDVTGGKVSDVEFRDTSAFGALFESGVYPSKVIPSFEAGINILWSGQASVAVAPTSQAILDLVPPKRTVRETLKGLLGQQ